jgi:hypothetical protein
MMKRYALVLLAAFTFAAPALAGVVYEVEVTDHTEDPVAVSGSRISVEGDLVKMDVTSGSKDLNGEMIFRGDRKEMVIVNNEDKTYFVLDEEQMKALAAQISQAMSAMEQALAAVPEGQRAKMEQMMKSRMPIQMEPRVPAELKKTGDSDTVGGYPCVRYEVWRGGIRERELWVTEWKNIEGGSDTAESFEDMSAFFKEMLDSLPQMGEKGFDDPMFELLKEMGGMPVVTREFDDDGSLESEARLKSASHQSLDPADFEPPADYKRKDMFGGMKGKKK